MTAIGYIRVSTNGQADGFGPEIQERAIKIHTGERLKAIYRDEGISGKLLDRPGLAEALRHLGTGDKLVVARLDRLARDLVVQEMLLAEIRRRGARLVSCAEGEQAYLEDDESDPSRRLIRQVLGAVAEYERAMVALRLRAGRAAKRANGGYAGGEPPFGWRVAEVGGLEEDEREQFVLQAMRDLARAGYGVTQIATMLNAGVGGWHPDGSRVVGTPEGFRPRRARRWTKESVHRILASIRLRGETLDRT